MTRSALTVLAASALAATLVGLAYGPSDGLVTFTLLLVLGALALGATHALAARRARLGPLRRQFGVGIGVAVGQLVVALAAGAALMFVSPHDALVLAAVTAAAGLVAVRSAQLLAMGVMHDVDGLRGALVAVGEGSRAPSPPGGGNDELAELIGAANRTIARLEMTEHARRDLIAAVSHDLRTPITSLRLLAQAVDDDIVGEQERRRYLRQMMTHIHALAALIDDLFELSQLESGELAWNLENVRLEELVGETVDAFRLQAEAKRVRVTAELSPGLRPARADPERLQRVLFNLVQNAIRHTPADGSVTVRAQPAGGSVEIEVADTGEGIGEADRARVFQPFFRGGEGAARGGDGVGLGLAISRAIVEGHGGRIWLVDAARGTRVRFSMPAAGWP